MMTERDFKRRGYEERKGSRERQGRKDLLDSEELGVGCRVTYTTDMKHSNLEFDVRTAYS